MARADFAQPQADRSATANARRRTDRAPAPRPRRRRTARARSPRRSSGPAHGCRRHWCREFASVKMPFGSRSAGFRVWPPSYPAIAAEANRPISSCFPLHPDTPGAREPGIGRRLSSESSGDCCFDGSVGTGGGLSSAGGSAACEGCAGAGRSGSGANGLNRRDRRHNFRRACGCHCRVRATASPLSKSSALSHALARKLSMRSSSHSRAASISKAPCSRWSINCIPWPVTAHCLPIQKMSRCNAIFALRYLSRSIVLSPPI